MPPLRTELSSQFDPRKNPFLDHCDHALFLLERGGRLIGRIAAFIDHLAVDYWGEPIGLFGYYECVAEPEASKLLLDAARDWLQQRRMTPMRGPWTFVSQEWGLVVEGFDMPPVLMAPHNPTCDDDAMIALGLAKVKDLLCYYISAAEGYPSVAMTKMLRS